jgi:hypothetical protein
MDHTEALPDDALADILSRLTPRDVAASRCVRKAWLAVVDAHRLLPPPHVFPHSVRGLCINYIDYETSHLFARPSEPPAISIDFLQDYHIVGHCNGLLLCRYLLSPLVVANPATRRWDFVDWKHNNADPYLVFDPAASSHYEVFSIPNLSEKVTFNSHALQRLNKRVNGKFSGSYGLVKLFSLPDDEDESDGLVKLFSLPDDDNESMDEAIEEGGFEDGSTKSPSLKRKCEQDGRHDLMEWPPSLWTLNVFSSSTREWQTRSFVREGEAAGTMTDVLLDPLEPESICYGGPRWRYSTYWQGSLYVHCRGLFVVRYTP